MITAPRTSTRSIWIAAGAFLLVESIAVAVLVARSAPEVLPVVTSSGATTFTVAEVDIGVGVIVPLVLGALLLLTGAVADPRIRWLESSVSSSIAVFLIAELNGIRELETLVAIYALTSAVALLGALQEGRRDRPRMLPAVFGAMVGIVPWGLIAWYEIAPAVATGTVQPGWVRVVTLIMLTLFLASAANFWWSSRRIGPWRRPLVGARLSLLLTVLTRSALAWLVAGALASGAASGAV